MKNTTKLLKIRNARAFLKEATVAELQQIQTNLDKLIAEKEEEEAAAEREREEKERALNELLSKAKDLGISKSDILNSIGGGHKNLNAGKKRQYRVNGEIIHWGGRGPMPAPLKSLKENGDDIEKYRIDSE